MDVAMTGYPRQLADVEPAWVERALRSAHSADLSVAGINVEQIGQGVGFIGELARINVRYADIADPTLPTSLIAKFSSPDAGLRQFIAMYGMYRTEVNFYKQIAATVSLRTPRCYFAEISEDGTECALLFEDLTASGRIGDQIAGCTLEEARSAIVELAGFHTAWWDSPKLDQLDWLPMGIEQMRTACQVSYPVAWQPCIERFEHLLSPRICAAIPTMHTGILPLLDDAEAAALTILHGDFRLDNMFFGSPGSDYPLAVIDWQVSSKSWGIYDIAYFLTTNLDTETRRRSQFDLLRAYHDGLRAGGVRDYRWEDCREDYRRGVLLLLAVEVVAAIQIDPANDRGLALFELIMRRVTAAVEDLDVLALLP